jgi:hypothetical protein
LHYLKVPFRDIIISPQNRSWALKALAFFLLLSLSFSSLCEDTANYEVEKGSLHKGGKFVVRILPETDKYKVVMDYDVEKKGFVPVPAKLLKGTKEMEFPKEFRTEAGYKELEKKGTMDIPKAQLKFVSRGDDGDLKNAYFIQVLPTNKKSKIDIVYHPSLPSVGWNRVTITFISPFPILDGYELKAVLKR